MIMGEVIDITDELEFLRLTNNYSYWLQVPKKIRMKMYLKHAQNKGEFYEIMDNIDSAEILKYLEDFNNGKSSGYRLANALLNAFEEYYHEHFDEKLDDERFRKGKYIYDEELGHFIEP
jgi:hypothetical protein|tara:strand:- start:994 stop:1350 length:357 start_codon:yes stop_codon:yes gene_type:complete